MRILAIDNEESVGRAVRRALFGYHVTTVTSGADALARIGSGESFDAVICDVVMPDMDGHEFALRLSTVAPRLAEKTLFLTGDPGAVHQLAGRPVLMKPIETHLLRSHLEQVVKPSGMRERFRDPAKAVETTVQQQESFSQRPTRRPPPHQAGGGGEE